MVNVLTIFIVSKLDKTLPFSEINTSIETKIKLGY
jgi:hypothetical protein